MIGQCPNDPPCGHGLHDVYDDEDPYPTCCIEGCKCGHPGDAAVIRHDDGTLVVERADPVIRVTVDLLNEMGLGIDDELVLDTAGEYRYRYLRPDPADSRRVAIYGRVKG